MNQTPQQPSHNALTPQHSTGVQWVRIDADRAGQRIDNFLMSLLRSVPKSLIYKILRKGEVRVNKKRVKPDYRVQCDDQVRIPPIQQGTPQAPPHVHSGLLTSIDDNILYEDDRILVVNKPTGLAVHGGSGIRVGLIEALRSRETNGRFLELVHRLDRDTSGCIVVAKKRSALRQLHEAFRNGDVVKSYRALLHGHLRDRDYEVRAPLHKFVTGSGERMVRVSDRGKSATTTFTVIERYEHATLVEAHPLTGRTHQIRVHAQHLGHAIVGDSKYASCEDNQQMKQQGCNRLFLHAWRLSLPVYDGMRFEAPLDDVWNNAIRRIRHAIKH